MKKAMIIIAGLAVSSFLLYPQNDKLPEVTYSMMDEHGIEFALTSDKRLAETAVQWCELSADQSGCKK